MTGPAFVTGFAAEARVAQMSGWPVAVGGGTTDGAAAVTRGLIKAGATGLVSFGFAGGLDPTLCPGTVTVPDGVIIDGVTWRTDPDLNARLGGATGHLCLALGHIAASAAEKRELGRATGAALVDMESGAVAATAAEHRVPFAVLRAICDPVNRDLPPAAVVALDREGRLAIWPIVRSILISPAQIGALLGLARDAAAARRALLERMRLIS